MTNQNLNPATSAPAANHSAGPAQSPRTEQEIEIKFAAQKDTAVPNLASLGPIISTTVHHLHATYYDTDDLRLFRNKITLRHRQGGKDDGWHIKFPGVISRLEVQAPDTPDPTDDFLEPIRAIIRDRPLVAIATIDNERHETVVETGEFVDDHVTAVSLLRHGKKTVWREWEFEFHGAPDSETRNQVVTLLHSTGAVEATSPSKLRTALGSSVRYAPVPAQPVALDSPLPLRNIFTTLNARYRELLNLDPYMRGMGETTPLKEFYKTALDIRSAMGLCAQLVAEHSDDPTLTEELGSNVLRIDALLEALQSRKEEEYVEFLRSYDYYALLDGIELILGQKWDDIATASTLRRIIRHITKEMDFKHPKLEDLSRLAVIRTALLAQPKSAKLVRATTESIKLLGDYLHICEDREAILNEADATTSTSEAFDLGRKCAVFDRKLAKAGKKFQASVGELSSKLEKKLDQER